MIINEIIRKAVINGSLFLFVDNLICEDQNARDFLVVEMNKFIKRVRSLSFKVYHFVIQI